MISKPNCGLLAARNTAILDAKGIYLFMLDSDDTACEGAFKRAYGEIQRYNFPDILHGKLLRVSGNQTFWINHELCKR